MNKTLEKFCEILFAMSDGERQIEIVRQILCEQKHFESYSAFRRLDRNRKNFLESQDIYNFLVDNGIKIPLKACSLFINKYDRDADNKLDYNE